jgi:hypothetical protein
MGSSLILQSGLKEKLADGIGGLSNYFGYAMRIA